MLAEFHRFFEKDWIFLVEECGSVVSANQSTQVAEHETNSFSSNLSVQSGNNTPNNSLEKADLRVRTELLCYTLRKDERATNLEIDPKINCGQLLNRWFDFVLQTEQHERVQRINHCCTQTTPGITCLDNSPTKRLASSF